MQHQPLYLRIVRIVVEKFTLVAPVAVFVAFIAYHIIQKMRRDIAKQEVTRDRTLVATMTRRVATGFAKCEKSVLEAGQKW